MQLDAIRTFVAVAETGNFHAAATRLNVTQSTVSARVRNIETDLGRPLFQRQHSGVVLTEAGRQFFRYAENMMRLWRRARQDVALSEGYRATFGLGSQFSLWDRLVLKWIPWMREAVPDVALRVEADYSPSLMRYIGDGILDVAVMYQPQRRAGLVIEDLMVENLVMVSTRPEAAADWQSDYVFVHWGRDFQVAHAEAFPEQTTPGLTVGLGALGLNYILEHGGTAYFPVRVVRPLIAQGRLFEVPDMPVMQRNTYVVYDASNPDRALLDKALTGLKEIAANGEVSEKLGT
jgi:DNA-binding transcriptional LysR family regulator